MIARNQIDQVTVKVLTQVHAKLRKGKIVLETASCNLTLLHLAHFPVLALLRRRRGHCVLASWNFGWQRAVEGEEMCLCPPTAAVWWFKTGRRDVSLPLRRTLLS